ncbi:MAG: type II CAAX endopeptidase family protein [Oscillospiraceae bacterium]
MREMTFKQKVSRMSMAYFILLVLTSVFQGITGGVLMVLAPDFNKNPIFIWVLTTIPLYLMAVPFFLLIMKKIPNTSEAPQKKEISIGKFLKILAVAFAFMMIGNLISMALISLIAVLKGSDIVNPLETVVGGSNWIYTLIFGAIEGPIGEELLFRYLPYKKLREYGEKAYILVSALIFGLFHANLFQIFYAFLIGAVLAYVYAKTGKIIYSILLHMALNAYGMVLAPMIATNEMMIIPLSIFIYALMAVGIFFCIKSRKTVTYDIGTTPLPEKPLKAALVNVGFIVFFVSITVLTVATMLI